MKISYAFSSVVEETNLKYREFTNLDPRLDMFVCMMNCSALCSNHSCDTSPFPRS